MPSIQEKIIKPKLGLLELAKQLGSVSQACKVMGYSRDSFYRFKELYAQGGAQALMDLSRRKPILKNRVPEHVENAVVELAIENPALGQKRASWELQRRGIMVSSSGIRSIWLRNELETMKKRLKALEARLGFKVERVMTDNGSCYRSFAYRDVCKELGLRHIRTKPYTPKTNGKAERFIQTALREWAYTRAYETSEQRKTALPKWTHMYNWHRPHAALKARSPISRLNDDQNNLLRLHN